MSMLRIGVRQQRAPVELAASEGREGNLAGGTPLGETGG